MNRILSTLFIILSLFLSSAFIYAEDVLERKSDILKIREYRPNYIAFGKPDTKVQFSFKFRSSKKLPVFFAYTQVMFWDLDEESNPFSEINYNPEIFYQLNSKVKYFDKAQIGYSHKSNGEDGTVSRSIDSIFVQFVHFEDFKKQLPRMHLRLRYFFNEGRNNEDFKKFVGPVSIKLFFDQFNGLLFKNDEFYAEYYNGGEFGEDFSRSSIRLSMRFKLWNDNSSPKLFLQYFNGYNENMANYNERIESIRFGISIGGL